jgi:Family of unknown function (DUF5694)
VRIATGPDDRVLLVMGSGHAFLQKQFAGQSGAFKVAETETALGCH